MNRLFCICALIQILVLPTKAKCPEGMIASLSDNTTCYLFISQKKPFLIAEEIYNQNGGHLSSIHDVFENMFIRENAQQNFTDSASNDFWIGLNDLKMQEAWNWIDGTPLDYVDWDKGQPNKSLGCDCGCIELQRGTWVSKNCDDPKPFVCRMSMSLEPVTTPKPKNQCPETWTYHSSTEACYKVYTQDTNWTYAENFCFSKGGAHLVSIHSLEENAFVTNLIPFDPNNHKCNTLALAWIGLFSVTQQESWQWTDNSPFNYSLWAPGKPPGKPYNNFCTVLWNGPTCDNPIETWADWACQNTSSYFVCKKPAS